MLRLALALLVASPLATGCKRGNEPKAEVSEETRPSPDRGSAGGFSASLSADLEVRGSGTAKGSGDFFSDVGEAGNAGSGSNAGTTAGSNTASTIAGSNATATNVDANAGSAVATNAGSADKPAVGSGSAKAPSNEIEMTPVTPPEPPTAMTAELKAIKLSLLPNWKRDVVEPATISLEVDVQSKDVKETFMFHYGYVDAKAPTDREAYKKYLAEAKIMKVTTDRQRGAAWYLEGNDAAGQFAFVLIVTWGGKRLYCGGSSYKDNSLGDIRDEVVVQAKKICETVAL